MPLYIYKWSLGIEYFYLMSVYKWSPGVKYFGFNILYIESQVHVFWQLYFESNLK